MANIQFNDKKILFVDNKIAFGAGCCCDAIECTCCDPSDDVPDELQVTISGLSDNTCDDCDDLNGVYILPVSVDPVFSPAVCIWKYVFSSEVCGVDYIAVILYGASVSYVVFGITYDAAIFWNESPNETSYDCLNLDETWSDVEQSGNTCDVSGSTARIEAL